MSNRSGSIMADVPVNQTGEGGSLPTPLLKRDWRVSPISLDRARELVRRFHYAKGTSNTAVYALGVMPVKAFMEAEAVAVSWWLPPTKVCGASVWPKDPQAVLSLSRLVCDERAPKNTPSFLLSHVSHFIDPERWPIWITFADEWQHHTGAIYLAAGWFACGYTKAERTYQRSGRMVSRKAGPKTRTHDEMLALGCECIGSFRRRRFVHVRADLKEEFEPIRLRLRGEIA